MSVLPTLYKKDSKGKIREFHIAFNDNQYVTQTGIQGGKLVNNITNPTPKGKNTLAQQVEKEARSKWRNKFERKLYSEDLSKPHPLAFVQPMGGLDYTKVPHRLVWESSIWIAQPKLNGVRCTVSYINSLVTLTSREGTIYNVPHIQTFFTHLYENFAPHNRVFDGELYIHGVELGDVTHAVAHGDPQLLFKLFDHADETKTFAERYLEVCSYALPLADTHIDIVQIDPIRNEEELKEIHREYVKAGYEGAMIRDNEAKYTLGRKTPGMFKYKHFQDDEFIITGVDLDKDGGAILILTTANGTEFKSRPTGSDAHRKRIVQDIQSLIGKKATVKYSELLKTGVPEFNRVIAIRDYE